MSLVRIEMASELAVVARLTHVAWPVIGAAEYANNCSIFSEVFIIIVPALRHLGCFVSVFVAPA